MRDGSAVVPVDQIRKLDEVTEATMGDVPGALRPQEQKAALGAAFCRHHLRYIRTISGSRTTLRERLEGRNEIMPLSDLPARVAGPASPGFLIAKITLLTVCPFGHIIFL
jgi:hypothetical protein